VAISFAVSLSLTYLWHEQYGKGDNGVAGSNIGFFIPIAAAAVSLSIIYSVQLLQKRTLARKQFWVNLSVGILAASIGVFGFTSTINGWQSVETSIASDTDIRALNWLRENSGDNDVVATNRLLCREGVDCGFDDSSYLISAISQRRVLVEGPRFVIGGRPYPQWTEERIALLQRVTNHLPHVQVEAFDGLAVDFVRAIGAKVMVRGVRPLTDIATEFTMMMANRQLDAEIETVFLMADEVYAHVSSTLIKQIATQGNGRSLERFVPSEIIPSLMEKVRSKRAT
jgi:pantetheine-phosphate adenylyltransferase